MNDSNRSLNEVPALIQERRRYEGWLGALDARRDSTPQHVLERVKADYQGRLQRVQEQLALHRQSILEERASVESRRSLIEAEEQLRRDERAELELRAHVGELAGASRTARFAQSTMRWSNSLTSVANSRLASKSSRSCSSCALRPRQRRQPHRVGHPMDLRARQRRRNARLSRSRTPGHAPKSGGPPAPPPRTSTSWRF